MLPIAIGAVVDGDACASHTPDSGQRSPVRAVVPIALAISVLLLKRHWPGHTTVDYAKEDQ